MAQMETLLSELFGFQRFIQDEGLQDMIDDTLGRYDDDFIIPLDDLAAAAGGVTEVKPGSEGSGKK